MADPTPCAICAQAKIFINGAGEDTDTICDKCETVQVHSVCAAAHQFDPTHGKIIFQDDKTGELFWHCGGCCAEPIQPAPPATDEDAEPAPRADSENAQLVTEDDESADDAGTEDVGPPPKRARASSLEDCLEELRKKIEEEFGETFNVDVALAWCDAKGAKKISHIVEFKRVDAFVAHLDLKKEFPALRLTEMILKEFAA